LVKRRDCEKVAEVSSGGSSVALLNWGFRAGRGEKGEGASDIRVCAAYGIIRCREGMTLILGEVIPKWDVLGERENG